MGQTSGLLSLEAGVLVDAFAAAPDDAEAARRLAGLAGVLMARGLRADARELCRRACDLSADPEVRVRARLVASTGVPGWHRGLVRDPVRADAYDRAVRSVVRPGDLVLDIGTGSGLLAMMAARAGAELVVACERDPLLAAVAADVVARNGLSDRVRVVPGDSRDLRVGVDLARRADVVVSEIIANDVVAEDVLGTLRAARRDLLTGDAVAVPGRAGIHVALAAVDPHRHTPVGSLAGFDLSPFAEVVRPLTALGDWTGVTLRSEGAELFAFDLDGRAPDRSRTATVGLPVRGDGPVSGIVQWMVLDLVDGVRLGAGPGDAPTVWGPQLHLFEAPVAAVDGHEITVGARHCGQDLMIWAG